LLCAGRSVLALRISSMGAELGGGDGLLTSESLKELKRVIQIAYEEHEDISRQLDAARQEKQTALDRYQSVGKRILIQDAVQEEICSAKRGIRDRECKIRGIWEVTLVRPHAGKGVHRWGTPGSKSA